MVGDTMDQQVAEGTASDEATRRAASEAQSEAT